jgi:hypothetical protein
MSRLTISDSTLCIQELVPFVDHLVDGSFEAPSPYLRWWLWVDPSMHILSLQSCLFVLLFCLHLHQQSLVNQHLRWPPLGHSYCVSSITKSNSTGSCSDCRLINQRVDVLFELTLANMIYFSDISFFLLLASRFIVPPILAPRLY